MRNRLLPLALLALAALAGLWFAARGGGRGGAGERTAARPPVAAPTQGANGARPADLAGASGEADGPAPAQDAAPAARGVAATAYEQELASGLWVEGRVVFPPDTPRDERVRVVAKGGQFEHGPVHSAEVTADGGFRVAFPAGVKSGRLDLEARYLYLDEAQKIDPRNPEPVVLDARLGGVLSGKVLPPPDVDGAADVLTGRRVQISAMRRVNDYSYEQTHQRHVELEASLAFEFTALPPDLQYDLTCDAAVYEPVELHELQVQAGDLTSIELQMLDGVDVAGRVLDDGGAPVAGALVRAQVEVNGRGGRGQVRQAVSDADGAFELRGLSPGRVHLEAKSKGRGDVEHDLGRRERGTALADVELRFVRGSALSGRVLWPDGTPAEGASVTAEPLEPRVLGNMGGSKAVTDASGAFTITGLEPGAHKVSARASRKETVMVKSELLGKERPKSVRTTLRATVGSAETGATGIELKLSQGEGLSGAATDDLGVPLEAFRVLAEKVVRHDGGTLHHGERKFPFKDAHGAFTVTGLDPGTYRITVEAAGHLPSDGVEADVPREAALAPMRLLRAARVSGVVLTPQGEPAPRARIETTGESSERRRFSMMAGAGDQTFSYAGVSDEQGRFESDDLGLGQVKVRAALQGYAPSALLELALVPGALHEKVTLRLSAGATLTGVVLDAGGKQLARRAVEVERRSAAHEFQGWDDFDATVVTDEAGAFEVSGLEPGLYTLVSPPTDAELAALGVSLSDGARDALAAKAEAEVSPQGAHVVLQAPSVRPIRVQGTVTVGGQPAQARIQVAELQSGHHVSSATDASGTYELMLPAPGSYWFSFYVGELTTSITRTVLVTAEPEQRCDLDVPVGAVSGRVHGPSGPVAGIRVDLRNEVEDVSQERAFASATTDKDGRYALEHLPVGTWTVQAGGGEMHRFGESQPSLYTRGVVEHVAVASGQHVRDVDLFVGAAGTVSGRVLTAAGEPAAGALIQMRRASGELVESQGSAQVDMEGRFSLGGLEPGDYTLGALHGLRESAEVEVAVEVGKDSQVEVRLAPATLLRVVVRDQAGALTQAHVTCLRSDGADFSSWVNRYLAQEAPGTEQRIGPLPPGTYTVKADRQGATPDTKTVTLDGEPELLVELVL